jgi:RHS repeat-associated protein
MIAAGTNGSTNYPQWGLSETYDRFGNRWTQAVTAGTAPGASLTFGLNGMNSSTTNQPNGYTYDASGNLTVEPLSPSNNYTYDGENRMVAFSGTNGAASYTYDGNGNRVQNSLTGGTSTVSIFAGSAMIAEYDNGATPTSPSREYVQSAATGQPQLLAMITGGTTTTFYHNDHLSVRLTTDGTVGSPTYGQVLSQEGHFPFGESWYQSGPTNKWFFTSYDRDSESGLDYALARYYDSRTGTFCSADPLAGSPDDPQTWNRYPYGRNDPVDMIDPSGQGFLGWLELAGLLLTDIATGGAAAGETTPLATAALGGVGLDTWAQAMHMGNEIGQGQQQPAQQAPAPQGGTTSDTTRRLNCIQLALNKIAPGTLFRPKQGPNGEDQSGAHSWGGHMNGTFETGPISQQTANQISNSVQGADKGKVLSNLFPGVDHGARYPSDPSVGGSAHIPSGDVTTTSAPGDGSVTVTASAHIDTYNPRSGPGGVLGHAVHDVIWGTIKQKIFHGDLVL